MIHRSHTEKQLLATLQTAAPDAGVLARCADASRCLQLYRGILLRAGMALHNGAMLAETHLGRVLLDVPDPERVLLHLDRFLEASFNPAGLLEDLFGRPALLGAYARLVSASRWLADTLVREARLFRWLFASGVLDQQPTHAAFRAAASGAMERFGRSEQRLNALRRYQRRELLRIAAADVLGRKDLAQVLAELSALADAVVACAWEEACRTVAARRAGAPPRAAIIALGKLGGGELNYSSDIDLMIVYARSDAPETRSAEDVPEARRDSGMRTEIEGDAGDARTAAGAAEEEHERAVAAVKELVRALTEVTHEGMLYRTDLRLRPDGASGALTLSLPATLSYYESRGQLWERQMLLRARVCAGDTEFGRSVLRALRPFVYPRTLTQLPSELATDVVARLAERWSADRDVKHMRGGIRQLEFSVQVLQMLHAPHRPELRTPSTLTAIDVLTSAALLTLEEEALLRDAYLFLRRVEHLLQLEDFEQTHTLPGGKEKLRRVAWALGFAATEAFEARVDAVRSAVERICDGLLPHGDDGDGARVSLDRFRRPEKAAALLADLLRGRASRPRSRAEQERLHALRGTLVRELNGLVLPDEALAALEQLLHRAAAPAAVLALLEQDRARALLLRFAAEAPVLLRNLETDPLALELVFSGYEPAGLGSRRLHRVRSTAAHADFLLGHGDLDGLSEDLTDTADTLLARACADAAEHAPPFVVLAMGKYGGRELIPGSDLDVIFLFEDAAPHAQEAAQVSARGLIAAMRGDDTGAPLYDVDARLRPEGGSAPLAVSRTSWLRYLETRASLWEIQSLLRARPAAGDAVLAGKVRGDIAALHARFILTTQHIDEVRSMRAKMEPQSRFRRQDFFDIKRSPGGMVDGEFAAQLLFLAQRRSGMGRTAAALSRLRDEGAADPALLDRMRAHYDFLRRLQLLFRVLLDMPGNLFPDDEAAQGLLAAVMGAEGADALRTRLAASARQHRADFEAVCAYLADRSSTATEQ